MKLLIAFFLLIATPALACQDIKTYVEDGLAADKDLYVAMELSPDEASGIFMKTGAPQFLGSSLTVIQDRTVLNVVILIVHRDSCVLTSVAWPKTMFNRLLEEVNGRSS